MIYSSMSSKDFVPIINEGSMEARVRRYCSLPNRLF